MRTLIAVAATLLVLTGCELVFTTSPLAFLQRDPSKLSAEQQITYAQNALASGDRDAMAKAFQALKGSSDPAVQLLAVDLAVGAAGVEGALIGLIADLGVDGVDETAALDAAIASFSAADLALIAEAATLLDAADDSLTPTPEQYVFVAVGLLAIAAEASGGVAALDGSTAEQQQAEAFLQLAYDLLQESGSSTDLIEGLGDAFGFAPS
ncbi:MAG: hypothetical protein EA382_06930 [Spirochaetaceae bacterium]|nr:MAG: hypothetical protein EA382_06930 [Spirochaetaceae bacterium]